MTRLAKLRQLPASERRLAFRALGSVALARVGVSLLSFPALARLLTRVQPRSRCSHSPDRIAWAIAAAGRLVPRSTCFTEAVAAHLLLRRCGWPAVLCLGVLRRPLYGLQAHAWVESQGRILVGRGASEGFTRLARIGEP